MIILNNKVCLLKLISTIDAALPSLLLNLFEKILLSFELSSDFYLKLVLSDVYLVPFVLFLKKHSLCMFSLLIDLTCFETLGDAPRFVLIYNLLSLKFTYRLYIKIKIQEYSSHIVSIASLYLNSKWLEREIYDFYGLYFNLHRDLRRLLLDYGFSGHPLRKDFPISGFTELSYDDSVKKIVYTKLELAQEYRLFFVPKNKWL